MNGVCKTILAAAVTALAMTGSMPSTASAQSDGYWRRHWSWYDTTYRPYYERRWQRTPLGGGYYRDTRETDPSLQATAEYAPLGGGSYRMPRYRDPATEPSRSTTPIGGGSYHAPRRFYEGATKYRPRPGSQSQLNRFNYGWW